MLLGDFIKELKHNSVTICISSMGISKSKYFFEGSLGVLKNNVHYQEEWNKYKIFCIEPYYDDNMKTAFEIDVFKR